jgi:hypothetical protein
MTSSSSMSETMRISREHFGHRSGSASHTFLINSRYFLEGMRRGSWGTDADAVLVLRNELEYWWTENALLTFPVDGVACAKSGIMEMETDSSVADLRPDGRYRVGEEGEHRVSKRGRLGEGRPTRRTPEVVAKIAEAVAIGLTDEEASLLAGINPDTMTEWRKGPEFSGAIKRAGAQRLLMRLERIEAGEQGWQGTAWALERLYPHRFARPEVMNQIAVVAGGKAAERVIVLPGRSSTQLLAVQATTCARTEIWSVGKGVLFM